MPTVVISPYSAAAFPEGGGHLWVYLQYVLGLRQLGCEVYWLEAFRSKGRPQLEAAALTAFRDQLQAYGLDGRVILYVTHSKAPLPEVPTEYFDLSKEAAEAVFERADLLLNFHYAISPALLARFRRTALVDIDPGLLQFWISRGQLSVPPHDLYVTTGETVGTPSARFPDCGLDWIHVRPPVCLERWPYVFDPSAEAFTTVSNWSAKNWIVDGTDVYENTKRAAFLEYADLPRRTDQPLELALCLRTEADVQEGRDLESRGWRVRQAADVVSTPEQYRRYIQRSRGEFSCAKRSCMRFQNAWVSDRTLCYLASGKPAVVQHTGPSSFLPDGEGLFRFSTPEEAADALDRVNADYQRHSRAARDITETFFDAKQILAGLLERTL